MRVLTVFIALLISSGLLAADKEQAMAHFSAGNDAYEQGDYELALSEYSKIGEDFTSFEYHYNLGNIYYELDSVGKSILHYEKAAKIDPGDEDLSTNLSIANQKVMDKIEALPSLGVDDLWDNLIAANMLKGWSILSLAAWILFLAMIGAFVFAKSAVNKRFYVITMIIALITTVIGYGLASASSNRISETREAVVLSPKVDVLDKPNGTETQFVLHEGTKVKMRQVQGDWIEIRIANGSVGWIRETDSAPI